VAGYAHQMGVPAASAAAVGSGVIILAGGLMVALGIWGDLGALLLAAFLLSTALLIHAFWKIDDEQKTMQMIQFMKNVSMAGGAVALFALFATVGSDLRTFLRVPPCCRADV
jgi:putative oxidoreductase